MTTLDGLLRKAVDRWGDLPFLLAAPPPVASHTRSSGRDDDLLACVPKETYRAFDRRVDVLAAGLRARGIGMGSMLGASLTSPRDLVWSWFAAARLGAVLVPLNPTFTTTEVCAVMRVAPTDAVLADRTTAGVVGAALRADPWLIDGVPRTGVEQLHPCAEAASPLTVLSTSGTTGRPKGCMLTHASYVVPAEDFGRWMKVTNLDRFFACLPLFHLAGQAFVAAAVASGASVILAPRFSGSRFWDHVAASGATLFRHLGEMLAVLCAQQPVPAERRHRLRAVYGGGAAPATVRCFERRFGVPVVEGYGLTETNTVLRNELHGARSGSIGRPTPYAEVRIADERGIERAAREIGEIQVRRNPVMTAGYLSDPAATDSAFVGDWYRTGDLGWQDDDAYFYFAGRTKDVIRRRGENIRACEIEDVLGSHPAVAAAAVVGVADEVGGEECKAFLVGAHAGTLSVDELAQWCRASLADFKIPRYFEICDELPRTPTNKVDKSRLREMGTVGGTCTDLLSTGARR